MICLSAHPTKLRHIPQVPYPKLNAGCDGNNSIRKYCYETLVNQRLVGLNYVQAICTLLGRAYQVPRCQCILLPYTRPGGAARMLRLGQAASCLTSARNHSTTPPVVTEIVRRTSMCFPLDCPIAVLVQ